MNEKQDRIAAEANKQYHQHLPENRLIRKRQRLGNNHERIVPILFPQTSIEATPAQITLYKAAGSFAFAIDRQSLHKEATRKGATGMTRRVDNILADARSLELYLPVPPLVPKAPEGALPFRFKDPIDIKDAVGNVSDFWFVDGTRQRATGYAANQNARPELWRAFLLAQALAKHGCAPKAFHVGEATRLFRDEGWLTNFVRALWHHKIDLHVSGFGPVTEHTLPGLIAYINAVSGWLGKVNQGARKIKQEREEIWHKNAPFALEFSEDGARVFAHLDQWNIGKEIIRKLAFGELLTQVAVSQWLLKEHGIHRTYSWVSTWLRSGIPEGHYDKAYGSKYIQRLLVQEGGLFFDLDITEGGNRRRLVLKQEGITKEVEHVHGTTPIPPEWIFQARRRVGGKKGRPVKNEDWPQSLLPFRILRCSVCKCGIREEYGPEKAHAAKMVWRLRCYCIPHIRILLKCTTAEAKRHKDTQHCRHRPGGASEAVWRRLWQAIKTNPINPNEPTLDVQVETERARRVLELAREEYARFQNQVRDGVYGDPNDKLDRQWIDGERERRKGAVRECETALETLSARLFSETRSLCVWQEVQQAFARITEDQIALPVRKQMIEQLVDRVELDLATGDFIIYGALDVPFLRTLAGNVNEMKNVSASRSTYIFVLTGNLALAA